MSKKWVKIWERGEYNLHKMALVTQSLFSGYAQKFLQRRFTGVLSIQMKNRSHAFCMTEATRHAWRARVDRIFLSNREFNHYRRYYEQLKKKFIKVSRQVGQRSALASRAELAKLMGDFMAIDLEYCLVGQWASFYLTKRADETMQQLADKKKMSAAATVKFLEIVLSPSKMSAIRQERQELLAIALLPESKKRAHNLDQHAKKFEWIPCINVLEPKPWTKKFFAQQLEKVSQTGQAAQELKTLQLSFRRVNLEFKKILKQFRGKDRLLVARAHDLAFIKDDRDDIRRRAYYYATPLYQAIARALKITATDLLLYTGDEIVRSLRTAKTLSRTELARRRAGYALLLEKNHLVVKTGRDYQTFLRRIESKAGRTDEVRGQSAGRGLVHGRARIVLSATELFKVKRGDILVTITTHPDYLPAMRLAAAFVTDEGGLTSHAAIVARELGKPCVVGTEIATQVFKDGDMIEVDAERGVIKKLG